jgi:hypothetical protein
LLGSVSKTPAWRIGSGQRCLARKKAGVHCVRIEDTDWAETLERS